MKDKFKSLGKRITTNANGEIDISDLVPGTYTITEENIDRYVPNQSQTITVSSDKTSSVSFYNILKKFRVTVTKQDYEKGHAQGDAKLSGAVYGLFKGNNLVAQYTTDQSGSFTTDYFVCGTDWTVREISPSEGYLLNDTVYKVGADPKDYTVEYNNAPDMTVMEQVIKGKISIIKHTDNGETQIETPEKGAEFQVYLKSSGSFVKANKDERDTIICDQDGFASTKLLPYGVYTVHQTKGWDGREKITDFDVFINTDGKTYKFLINNKNFESYLKVVKLDKETGKRIPYEGAAFEIYDSNNHRVTMQYTYPQVTSIHTFYTNKEGYLITPEKLPYGDYTLKEVQAPYGYILDDTPIPFSISQENSSTDTGVTVVKVKARDVAQKGVINITKTGEIFSSVEENNGVYTPKYSVGNLKGAVFEVYAAEDITTLDGTVRYEQGTLVDTITTDDDGVAKSKELYLGKYTVIEKTAPNGYVHNAAKYDAELTYAGQNVSVTSTDISVYNDRQKVSVSLKKVMAEDKTFSIGNNGEITSVRFGIYAGEDIKANNGDVIPKDALITFANCDKNGSIVFDCDLPIGFKWYVKEIATDTVKGKPKNHGKIESKDVWVKKLKCSCGASFRKNRWHKNKNCDWSYGYQCYNQLNNGSAKQRRLAGEDDEGYCDQRMIADWKLELMAKMVFEEVWKNRTDCISETIKIIKKCYRESKVENNQKNSIMFQIEKIKSKKNILLDMRTSGEITKDEFLEQKEVLNKKLSLFESEFQNCIEIDTKQIQIDYDEILKSLNEIVDLSNPKMDRELLQRFIAKIVPNGENHFIWYLNLDGKSDTQLNVDIVGNKKNALVSIDESGDTSPLHTSDILYFNDKKSFTVETLHRLLLQRCNRYS